MDKRKVKEYLEYLSRCPTCKLQNCGDDFHTLSKVEIEPNVGTIGKCLLLYIYQLVELHGLQKSEVVALFQNLVDEHIQETEE